MCHAASKPKLPYADSCTTRESNLQNYIQTIQPRLKGHPLGISISHRTLLVMRIRYSSLLNSTVIFNMLLKDAGTGTPAEL